MSRPAPIGCRRRKRLLTPVPARCVSDDWREHIESVGTGLHRIKKHGSMKVDAMIVADSEHLKRQTDDSPSHFEENSASPPPARGQWVPLPGQGLVGPLPCMGIGKGNSIENAKTNAPENATVKKEPTGSGISATVSGSSETQHAKLKGDGLGSAGATDPFGDEYIERFVTQFLAQKKLQSG